MNRKAQDDQPLVVCLCLVKQQEETFMDIYIHTQMWTDWPASVYPRPVSTAFQLHVQWDDTSSNRFGTPVIQTLSLFNNQIVVYINYSSLKEKSKWTAGSCRGWLWQCWAQSSKVFQDVNLSWID